MTNPTMTKEKRELGQAYLATDFVVNDEDISIKLRVGKHNSEFDQLLQRRGVTLWAFVTAQNPRSTLISAEENNLRQSQLVQYLKSEGYGYLEGFGQGTDGDWPAEESVLILEIKNDEAVRIGRLFDQNAILVGRIGEPPELVWCD